MHLMLFESISDQLDVFSYEDYTDWRMAVLEVRPDWKSQRRALLCNPFPGSPVTYPTVQCVLLQIVAAAGGVGGVVAGLAALLRRAPQLRSVSLHLHHSTQLVCQTQL